MTGPEHYRAAELLIDSAGEFMTEGDAPAHDRCIAIAQVHATLALAAGCGRPFIMRPETDTDVTPGEVTR
jgi:hypothetical protein